MSLTQIITDSLRKNLVNGAGFYRSPNGIFEATWLPDEKIGYIDIINPNDRHNFLHLKKEAMKYLNALPKGVWQFNPDTTQKGKIYGERVFKGVPGVKPNPTMPHKALTFDSSGNFYMAGRRGGTSTYNSWGWICKFNTSTKNFLKLIFD